MIYLVQLDIVYMGKFSGPDEMSNTFRKTMKTMVRGFTVDLPQNVPLTWNSVLGLSSNCSVRSPRLYSSLVLMFG